MVRCLFITLAILTALVIGIALWFTIGAIPSILAMMLVLALGTYAAGEEAKGRLALRAVIGGLFVVGLLLVSYGALTVIGALTNVSGAVAPADEVSLASARQKFDDIGDSAAFRVEVHETELSAVAQHGLAGSGAPFRSLVLDIPSGDDAGPVAFEAESRDGELSLRGHFNVFLEAGIPRIQILDVDLGVLNVPGIAQGAVEDLLNPFVSDALDQEGIEIQSITLANDSLVVTGTQADGVIINSGTLLAGLRTGTPPPSLTVPAERFGPGVVNDTSADGSVYYVALGDSLAANVGVAEPRDGYVSRFHRQLQNRDGTVYGLRNFGISGETSASLIRRGQLESALQFIRTHEVQYITIDIGANDLLGHLTSSDCERLTSPPCRQRIEDSFTAYEVNLTRILAALREAVPEATMILLETYNPFSLGYESRVAFEEESNRVISDFNALAARVAEPYDVLVADGFTPLKGTTAVTTHILDNPPDIHPRKTGFDVLAAALVDALP